MRIRIVYYINVLKAIPLHEPQGFIQGRLKIGVSAQKGFGRHLVCGGIRSWSEQIVYGRGSKQADTSGNVQSNLIQPKGLRLIAEPLIDVSGQLADPNVLAHVRRGSTAKSGLRCCSTDA